MTVRDHRRNLPLASLSDSDWAVLAGRLSPFTFKQQEVLIRQGEQPEHIVFPVEGMISAVTFLHEGSGIEASAVGPRGIVGAIFGLGLGFSYSEYIAQIGGSGYRIKVAELRNAVEYHPGIRKMVDVATDIVVAQSFQSATCLAYHPVEARMARWLLTAKDEVRSNTLPLTQEFLAHMLGVQRTTVTLAAQALQAAGLMRYRRGSIELIVIAGLEASACECYGSLRERFARAYPGKPGHLALVSSAT